VFAGAVHAFTAIDKHVCITVTHAIVLDGSAIDSDGFLFRRPVKSCYVCVIGGWVCGIWRVDGGGVEGR
jgi:hypothetical protein